MLETAVRCTACSEVAAASGASIVLEPSARRCSENSAKFDIRAAWNTSMVDLLAACAADLVRSSHDLMRDSARD
jgi:hypothetical protein